MKEFKKKQREEGKRLKDEEKKKVAAISNSQSPNFSAAEDDNMQFHENRLKYLAPQKSLGINQFTHKFQFPMQLKEYIQKYTSINPGVHLKDVEVKLAGRIMDKRISSSKLYFYDLYGGGVKVQVMADVRDSNLDDVEFSKLHTGVNFGDIVRICGFPGKSKKGELCIFSKKLVVLTHCQKAAPGVNDLPTRNITQHHLKISLNYEVRRKVETSDEVISYIRGYLKNLRFLEVETSIMNVGSGGAFDKFFLTHLNDMNMKLFMRMTPELLHKQLIVGGTERFFEIGKQFRNEGIGSTCNSEFTTCAFSVAYADYHDLMDLIEQMISGMVKNLSGGYKLIVHSNGIDKEPIEIDFTPPFRRIDMIEELERMTNLDIPKDLSSDAANKYLVDACTKFNIICPPPQTTSRLLDKLVGHFIVETCVNPSFIMNHPEIMSSLAKWHRSESGLTERSELFINKHKVCYAYTEMNDVVMLRRRFAELRKSRQSADESIVLDEAFFTALEYGLPPSASCELGIDRLTLLLTDSQDFKEVILFPIIKHQDDLSSKGPDKLQMENSSAFIRSLVDAARHSGRNVLRKLSANIKLPAEDKLAKKFFTGSRVVSESAKARAYLNRPLSPHLPLKKPQLSATHSIPHRVLGVGVASAVLLFPLAMRFSANFGI